MGVHHVRCSYVQCAAGGRRLGAVAGACRAGQRVRCTSTAADRCVDRSSSALQTPHCSPAAARVYAASKLQLRPREAATWLGPMLLLQ